MATSLATAIKREKSKHKTLKQTYDDLPVGTKVQVITPCADFRFFRGDETGVVTANTKGYYGIKVTFDEPMVYEGGHKVHSHNFQPSDLKILEKTNGKCPHCGR